MRLLHQIHVYAEAQLIKTLPLRGVVGHMLSYEAFMEHMAHMAHQARAQQRLASLQERRYRTAAIATP
jgi:phosphoketolase